MTQHMMLLLGHTESGGGLENLWFFIVAYLLLWVLVFGYLYYLHGRVKDLESDLENQVRDPMSKTTNEAQDSSEEE